MPLRAYPPILETPRPSPWHAVELPRHRGARAGDQHHPVPRL